MTETGTKSTIEKRNPHWPEKYGFLFSGGL
jgi:hypothetical protein